MNNRNNKPVAGHARRRLQQLADRLTDDREELLARLQVEHASAERELDRIDAERRRQSKDERLHAARQRSLDHRERARQASERRQEVQAELREKELELERQRVIMSREREERAREEEEREREREAENQRITQEAIDVDEVDSGEEMDIGQAIRYVFANLHRLTIIRDGREVLNPAVIRYAPSPGAISLAHYALSNQQAFIEKFAAKLAPKDMSPAKDEGPSVAEELDPDLDGLQSYLQGLGGEAEEA